MANSGELSPRHRKTEPPALSAAAPTRRTALDRQILDQRARLDLSPSHPEPLDRDLTAVIQRYRFGLNFLLKSPWLFPDSTRGPELFKNNYAEVLFLAFDPLSFFNF